MGRTKKVTPKNIVQEIRRPPSQVDEQYAKQTFKDHKVIGIFFSAIALLLFVYGIFNQYWDTDCIWLSGPKYLTIEENHLIIRINKVFKSIEFQFENKIDAMKNRIEIISTSDKLEKNNGFSFHSSIKMESIQFGDDGTNIKISLVDNYPGSKDIFVFFKEKYKNEVSKRRIINSVKIDEEYVSIYKFYNEYIDSEISNILYTRAFDYRFMSNFIARLFGRKIIIIILFLLIVIFIIQLLLLALTFYLQIFHPTQYKIGRLAPPPLNLFDILSRDYAVIFGFFGTIASVWVALETSDTNFANQFEIFEIIKMAVFSTVIGLATRSTFAIREFLFDFYASRKIG